jgi:prepilin-type N-terminal cleavage/methylation domain-containing protein
MNLRASDPNRPNRQAGFTLVEVLVAVVVLSFGLMAVTNLLLVAATSTTVANHSTAATASASEVMDILRSTDWLSVDPGAAAAGSLTADTTVPSPPCSTLRSAVVGVYNCDDDIPGVGLIKNRWTIAPVPGTARLLQITVRGEGQGALTEARSRATFSIYRACTNSALGSCAVPGNPQATCCPQLP